MENNENKINKEKTEKQKIINDKMKKIFLNSFTSEEISEQKDNKKEENNDIITTEETANDASIAKKYKRYESIFNYRAELNLKKILKKYHLFYYLCRNPSEDTSIYKLGKILLFTYSKNFPKIINYKNKKTYTSDVNWGCMLRCGQMILSRGIYRLLKSKKLNTRDALYYTFSLFNNYPIKEDNLHKYFHGMINKFYSLMEKGEGEKKNIKIKEFFPPFSIRTICEAAELNERTAGEWFSDVIVSQAFKNISEYYELFNSPELDLKIMTFQSCIEAQDILDTCFVEKKFQKGNNQYIRSNNKFYYFDKMGLIFVNVRIGLDKIPKEYYKGIKELFNLKECIGIIGGKTRQAFYFIGYSDNDDSLLYLDPHVTKEDDKIINYSNILSKHVLKQVHLLKMSKMSTGFTIGFCFRTYEEFLNLYEFWIKAKHNSTPILGVIKQPIVSDIKHEDLDSDDF